ncbi:MAG: phosphonopyruvate decarboxylase [Deltaproteobacteria bacterium]|nr:phosphonopyruvate decarboxylase [Deltaproteobacteria bacterium]
MLDPSSFVNLLKASGFSFFTGVPDSLLKEFCACVTDQFPERQHIIAANEGAAIGLATGYHLATGESGLVYMQNSGIGNAINPLLSLADPDVYSIPMLVMIGWRGAPGIKDEPQHVKQGKVQMDLMSAIGYPHEILASNTDEVRLQIERLSRQMKAASTPVLLLVPKGAFGKYSVAGADTAVPDVAETELMTREQAVESILAMVNEKTKIVSTTGMTSREIFEIRERLNQGHHRDFLTVGSMGHAGMIALGIAGYQDSPVACIDGDGAVLMHMGALPLIAQYAPSSFLHFVLNNGAHDSVGGQPTIGRQISFASIASACGYKSTVTVRSITELHTAMDDIRKKQGPAFIEFVIKKGAREDLGRPTTTPIDNKHTFMDKIIK